MLLCVKGTWEGFAIRRDHPDGKEGRNEGVEYRLPKQEAKKMMLVEAAPSVSFLALAVLLFHWDGQFLRTFEHFVRLTRVGCASKNRGD